MPVPTSLLQVIAKAALPIITGGASTIVEIGSTIASKVWDLWAKRKEQKERRTELEALAQATAAELKSAIREVVAEVAKGQSPAEQSRLESYLQAVPAQIRRTLRRPSDMNGRTIPPDLALSRMEDLVPLLPPHPPRFAAGDRVGDFELIELLGIGGFGEVWNARNAFMPSTPPVALKFCIDTDAAASLRRETELLDRIQHQGTHPGIVQLRHTFLSAEPPFLEYELVEGGDLGGLIVEWYRQKGGPTPVEAARLIQRLSEIVAFAHARGITHRDLKPANILVQGDAGSSSQLKIADFGIGAITSETANRAARLSGLASTRTAAAACGGYSLYYASPEQIRDTAPADPRDDVHAIGVIWYQLLAGDLTAEAPRGPGWKKRLVAKGMSLEMIECLEACMASDREDRPASATAVAEQLGQMLAEAGRIAQPTLDSPTHPMLSSPMAKGSSLPIAQDPGKVVQVALQRTRASEYLSRLRAIQFGHRRKRWAGQFSTWLLQIALIAGLVVVIGLLITKDDEVYRMGHAYEKTYEKGLTAGSSNPPVFMRNIWVYLLGFGALSGLLVGLLLLRRWMLRTVVADTQALAERTQTDFVVELRAWPEKVDLKQSDDVERMLKAMEMAGAIRRPWKGPIWLFHRLFAPF